MTVEIEDDVPLPGDGWTSKPAITDKVLDAVKRGRSVHEAMREDKPQPNETDCTFVGGPLNGKFGPVKGNAKVVEIELYGPGGEVTSVELYALGDMHPTSTFRYHVGTKPGCNHKRVLQYTGDGVEVAFCPECGNNELTGNRKDVI